MEQRAHREQAGLLSSGPAGLGQLQAPGNPSSSSAPGRAGKTTNTTAWGYCSWGENSSQMLVALIVKPGITASRTSAVHLSQEKPGKFAEHCELGQALSDKATLLQDKG